MTPKKGQSSSCHKGKEIVSDPPAACDVGKKAMYFESNHSDKEEAQCALDSECAPLIDPWYDIHPHFLKVPSDYMAPQLGPCVACFLPSQYTCFLGSVGFLNPRPHHPSRHFTPRAHSLRIQIGHGLGLEGVGR